MKYQIRTSIHVTDIIMNEFEIEADSEEQAIEIYNTTIKPFVIEKLKETPLNQSAYMFPSAFLYKESHTEFSPLENRDVTRYKTTSIELDLPEYKK